MAKTIEFTYEGETYTLEFTRRTIKDMENEGFSLRALRDMPANTFPKLFAGAFRCHHRKISKELVEKMYKSLSHKEELAEKLAEMYNSALDTLFEEPEEGKNVEWKSNF